MCHGEEEEEEEEEEEDDDDDENLKTRAFSKRSVGFVCLASASL
jgi:hypothetical protein